MNWENIIKGQPMRRKVPTKVVGFDRSDDKKQNKRTSLREPKDIEEDSLDDVETNKEYEDMLAASTHNQLMDAFEEKLNELTHKELIEILVKTQGIIKLKKPKF
tara:strand:+ start:5668 stop:5979 length:312 start_codon:yes stop_codon:yes gene_type:complete